MIKDVLISMSTVQDVDSSDPNRLDFSTDGFYTYEDDVGCITYKETAVTGMEGTTTSVFVMPDKIVVDRDGTVTSRMVFQEGNSDSFLYDTPYGRATMGIRTGSLRHDFNENGGNFEIEYVINMEHKFFTKNRFTVNVQQIKNDNHPGGYIHA